MPNLRLNRYQVIGFALLLWFSASLTAGLQQWVGDATIYSPRVELKREQLHFAILNNELPGGKSWGAVGALTVQKRVAVVYLAELLRRQSGWPVGKVYKAIDSLCLLGALLALFFLLKRWVGNTHSSIGLLYFSAMLPFTYVLQLFHPWDRLQLVLWIGLIYLVLERRPVWLALGLMLSMFVKYDTIMLPLLYGLVHFKDVHPKRAALETLALFVLAATTYLALGAMFPAPLDQTNFNSEGAMKMLRSNLLSLARMGLNSPPLVVMGAPLLLALWQWPRLTHELKACIVFALFLSVTFILFSRYEEVRAQMIVLVLLLPAALQALARLLGNGAAGPSVREHAA